MQLLVSLVRNMFDFLKTNIWLVVVGIFTSLLGLLKYKNMKIDEKDTEISNLEVEKEVAVVNAKLEVIGVKNLQENIEADITTKSIEQDGKELGYEGYSTY